jgi:hypothetical protein
MNASRLQMLMGTGVDFFTGECLPGSTDDVLSDLNVFKLSTSSPLESFPDNSSISAKLKSRGLNSQWDNFWKNQDHYAKLNRFQIRHGHSLVLASDDIDLYWWFIEKRGKMLLLELNGGMLKESNASTGFHSQSIIRYITVHRQEGTNVTVHDQSMFQWLHYCDRLMIFKARKGHCKVPKDYPDEPLKQWLVQQHHSIHLYNTNHPAALSPVQLKILHAMGVHGSKRKDAPPNLSSRALKRKLPSRKDKKQRIEPDK